MLNFYLWIVVAGLLIVGMELFGLVSRELDLVCLGFVLVFGGLIGIFSGSLLLGFGVITFFSLGYFFFVQKVIHRWVREASKL